MHYAANARYWFDQIGQPKRNSYESDPLEAFKTTVIFGAVEGDTMPERESVDLAVWLEARKPALLAAMLETMRKHEVELIPGSLHVEPTEKPNVIRRWWA